jgi:hypothetical protein
MTQAKWVSMTTAQQDAIRDNSGLTSDLIGKEGWRVQVRDTADSEPRRFIVGKSTGWRPCHLEVHNQRSLGGPPARESYYSVLCLYRVC